MVEMQSFTFREAQDGKPSGMLPAFLSSQDKKDFNKQMMGVRVRVKTAWHGKIKNTMDAESEVEGSY